MSKKYYTSNYNSQQGEDANGREGSAGSRRAGRGEGTRRGGLQYRVDAELDGPVQVTQGLRPLEPKVITLMQPPSPRTPPNVDKRQINGKPCSKYSYYYTVNWDTVQRKHIHSHA